ncbi:hypothetical protein B0H14DRAFT_423001 [Mycena olivaceomarginata]|nr:hypothetical protein B0H14DRAFT_423001 [Mycena olivaceomarginata]
MRLVRSFSSSTCRARQGFFQDTGPKKLSKEWKDFLIARKRADLTTNSWLLRDSKVIRSVFLCQAGELNRLRSECARHIAAALAKLQDPASFEVQDLTFDQIMRVPTISYLPELALIDLRNPLGIPPDTPQSEIPPIHDPSLVAKALSEVGFSGAFLQLDRYNLNAGKQRWPIYPHIPYGGYTPPPRLHVDADSKLGGSVTLTLPGTTVQPLHHYFRWFAKSNPEFKATNELVTIWARSHNISLSPQAIALMVIAAMQGELFHRRTSCRGLVTTRVSKRRPQQVGVRR